MKTIGELRETLDAGRVGRQAYDLVADLYPLCRSITGDGVRETLRRLKPHIDVTLHEVPSGTRVYDWTVPREWNIRDAYVKNAAGDRVIDFRESNLHVVGYSVPVRKRVSLAELKEHVVKKIGAIARPDDVIFAADLPKTRSGKIMRRLLRDIAEGKTLGDTTTLADPAVVARLKEQYQDEH